MAALTRRESEERQNAVLRFFMENPSATGEEAQRALTLGRLTNRKPQPPMGLGMLFRLQRQAKDLLAKGKPPPALPPPQENHVATPPPSATLPISEDVVKNLRVRAKEIEELMKAADGVVEISITRDGVTMRVMRPAEEKF